MRPHLFLARAATFLLLAVATAAAQDTAPSRTLFENVRIFTGTADTLTAPRYVLVEGNRIAGISPEPFTVDGGDGDVVVIAGAGRTLMPGLIDAHTHIAMSTLPLMVMMTAPADYVAMRTAVAAQEMLMRGFTSARDLGGPTFGLKRAIDEGFVAGPRIWPSGATISQTSGHGDFRTVHDIPRSEGAPRHFTERHGFTAIADGRAEVLRAVREQLMQGASQIKVMAGGGVSSSYDPLDVSQYTADELRAAVEAAEDWGTYVAVHAYTPRAIRAAIEAGVRCIDHGQLADAATARLMAEQGVWWSLQPFLDDAYTNPQPEGSANRRKQLEMTAGTDRAYALAKEYGVKLAWGTDTLFSARNAAAQGAQLAKMTRWFTPAQSLRMATAKNAELLALSGPRNPYPGTLGVVAEGALADVLLIDGDPLENIDLIADPANITVIMKDGVIYKNTLPR